MKPISASKLAIAAIMALALALPAATGAAAQALNTFGVLAGSTVTNTGSSIINGNVGVSPGNAIVGFPPGIVLPPYTIYNTGAVPGDAQIELTNAYTTYQTMGETENLTGQDLAGLTLTAGVYAFDVSAGLNGTLILDGQGNPNALFVINIGSTLTTGSGSTVQLINGAQGRNVFFVVGSSATLGTETTFAGQILALTSITLNTGADINCGSVWARNGAVTLDTNRIAVCSLAVASFGSLVGPTSTPNAAAVAAMLDAIVTAGGALPLAFQNLSAFLTPDELAAAFAQLAGQLGTAAAPAGTEAMGSFLSQIFNRLDDGSGTSGLFGPGPSTPERGTVRALGYAPERTSPALQAVDGALSGGGIADPRLWNVWASVYGTQSDVDGDAGEGTSGRSTGMYGLAAGLDYLLSPDTIVGFAVTGARSDFDLDNGFGSGNSDIFEAAIYSRTYFDRTYVATALAFGWNDVSTERTVNAGGISEYSADFSAYDVAGQIEVGYRFDMPGIDPLEGRGWITPYAALQVQNFHTPSYSEDTVSGEPDFALTYAESDTTTVHTELGVKVGRSIVFDETVLTLRSSIAWAHDENSGQNMDASFQSIPDSSFRVTGADAAGDGVLLSAGAEVSLANGFSMLGLLDGRLSEDSETYSATARLSYAF